MSKRIIEHCKGYGTRILEDEDHSWKREEKPIMICCGCGEELHPLTEKGRA